MSNRPVFISIVRSKNQENDSRMPLPTATSWVNINRTKDDEEIIIQYINISQISRFEFKPTVKDRDTMNIIEPMFAVIYMTTGESINVYGQQAKYIASILSDMVLLNARRSDK